ncbi:MAG TPA: hypothetical protein VF865_04070 [Acidobacteriaceae bacterium]
MPNTSPAESLLTLFAGRERAAAILGDLTEMAATRGRLWFWTAYAQTLVSLTWRIVLALFLADIARELMFNLANLYFQVTPPTWRTTNGPYLLNQMGPLLACIMSTLWFVLPFAAVLYGVRDRFVRLTFVVALGTTVAFLFIPWASLVCAAATLTLAAAALISKTWRKPLEILLWSGAAGLLMIAVSTEGRTRIPLLLAHGHTLLARGANELLFGASLLVLAFVCARLHGLLLRPPSSADSKLA